MKLQSTQAEMIYMSLLHTLRSQGIEYDDKFERLSNELDGRHDAVDLLDLLDGMHSFIVKENEFEMEDETE